MLSDDFRYDLNSWARGTALKVSDVAGIDHLPVRLPDGARRDDCPTPRTQLYPGNTLQASLLQPYGLPDLKFNRTQSRRVVTKRQCEENL